MDNFKCLSWHLKIYAHFYYKTEIFIEPGPPWKILSLKPRLLAISHVSAPLHPEGKTAFINCHVCSCFIEITRLFYSKKIIFTSYINEEHESTNCTRKLLFVFLSVLKCFAYSLPHNNPISDKVVSFSEC